MHLSLSGAMLGVAPLAHDLHTAFKWETESNGVTYLEIAVLVQSSPREQRNEAQGGHIHILTREEEEGHRAAVGHTVFGQRLIDTGLGLEKNLKKRVQEWKKKDHKVFQA